MVTIAPELSSKLILGEVKAGETVGEAVGEVDGETDGTMVGNLDGLLVVVGTSDGRSVESSSDRFEEGYPSGDDVELTEEGESCNVLLEASFFSSSVLDRRRTPVVIAATATTDDNSEATINDRLLHRLGEEEASRE